MIRLYNIHEDKFYNITDTIRIKNVIYYTNKITEKFLNENGFYKYKILKKRREFIEIKKNIVDGLVIFEYV